MNWPKINFALWMSVVAGALAMEVYGLTHNQDATLTAIICKYIPIWGRAMILGWLAYHFLIQHSK